MKALINFFSLWLVPILAVLFVLVLIVTAIFGVLMAGVNQQEVEATLEQPER